MGAAQGTEASSVENAWLQASPKARNAALAAIAQDLGLAFSEQCRRRVEHFKANLSGGTDRLMIRAFSQGAVLRKRNMITSSTDVQYQL